MNQAILDKIRKVEPYVPGEQPKERVIKLNTNENPYPPAPGVAKVLKEMDADSLRLYPDPAADILVEELSRFYRVGKEQIFVGVGSDDVLSMCFLTFFNSDKPILFPDITYSFYKVWAQLYRIPYRCPKLDEQFCLVKEDYYAENGGIIFPNPNAPTAIYEDLDFIEDILRHNPDSVVIVDEAYIDFAGKSAPGSKKYCYAVHLSGGRHSMRRVQCGAGRASRTRHLVLCIRSFGAYPHRTAGACIPG